MAENPKELLANIAPFGLRMQPDLKERIKSAAKRNNRSLNAEIISALEEAFPDRIQVQEELNFIDEIDDIQQRLYRLRMVQMKASFDDSEALIKKADDLLKKPEKD